jgi:hypothetical protein
LPRRAQPFLVNASRSEQIITVNRIIVADTIPDFTVIPGAAGYFTIEYDSVKEWESAATRHRQHGLHLAVSGNTGAERKALK